MPTISISLVALIGNPCMPYDVCMKIFVGNDADIGELPITVLYAIILLSFFLICNCNCECNVSFGIFIELIQCLFNRLELVFVVHWEQTYFCGPFGAAYILEQFVRQSMTIPTKPIVVFSESSTGHWSDAKTTSFANEKYILNIFVRCFSLRFDKFTMITNFITNFK